MRKPYFDRQKKAWMYVNDLGKKEMILRGTQDQAEREWRRLTGAEMPDAARITVAHLASEYKASTAGTRTAAYEKCLWARVDDVAAKFGAMRVVAVPRHDVVRWLDSLGNKSRSRRLVVKILFRWAARELGARNELVLAIPGPKHGKRTYVLARADFERWMRLPHHWQSRPNRTIILATALAGCRPGETRKLRRRHVDMAAGTWTLQPSEHKTGWKTGKPKTVYMGPCLRTLTSIMLHARGTEDDSLLFCGLAGTIVNSSNLAGYVKRYRGKLGLPDGVIAYTMRHTFATHALMLGIPLPTVAALLGNLPQTLAQWYSHVDTQADHLRDAAERAMRRQEPPT